MAGTMPHAIFVETGRGRSRHVRRLRGRVPRLRRLRRRVTRRQPPRCPPGWRLQRVAAASRARNRAGSWATTGTRSSAPPPSTARTACAARPSAWTSCRLPTRSSQPWLRWLELAREERRRRARSRPGTTRAARLPPSSGQDAEPWPASSAARPPSPRRRPDRPPVRRARRAHRGADRPLAPRPTACGASCGWRSPTTCGCRRRCAARVGG